MSWSKFQVRQSAARNSPPRCICWYLVFASDVIFIYPFVILNYANHCLLYGFIWGCGALCCGLCQVFACFVIVFGHFYCLVGLVGWLWCLVLFVMYLFVMCPSPFSFLSFIFSFPFLLFLCYYPSSWSASLSRFCCAVVSGTGPIHFISSCSAHGFLSPLSGHIWMLRSLGRGYPPIFRCLVFSCLCFLVRRF